MRVLLQAASPAQHRRITVGYHPNTTECFHPLSGFFFFFFGFKGPPPRDPLDSVPPSPPWAGRTACLCAEDRQPWGTSEGDIWAVRHAKPRV